MDLQIPPQSMFFYRGKWTREMDAMLLSTLITLRRGREWEDANVPDNVLRSLCSVINPPFSSDLSIEDISVRVQLLKAQYRRFKKLVRTKGVQWNMQERVVTADSTTWKLIIKRDASAAAYFYCDEPDFNLLASFFGLYDVKIESSHEVITISDNTEVIVLSESDVPDAPIRGKHHDSPTDSDEVTSPMPGPASRIRCKLFDADIACFPNLSTPASTGSFNVGSKVIYSSPKGSSCASWSPAPKCKKTSP